MKAALAMMLDESCGYLKDEGWRQTAELMALAAKEIERLTERVEELETTRHTIRPSGPVERASECGAVHCADQRITGDTIALSPPLIVSENEIGEIFDKVGKVIRPVN
jgi:hypothetical protein